MVETTEKKGWSMWKLFMRKGLIWIGMLSAAFARLGGLVWCCMIMAHGPREHFALIPFIVAYAFASGYFWVIEEVDRYGADRINWDFVRGEVKHDLGFEVWAGGVLGVCLIMGWVPWQVVTLIFLFLLVMFKFVMIFEEGLVHRGNNIISR
jgi:hypothetical protein